MKTFYMLLQINCSDDADCDTVKEAVEDAVAVEICDGCDHGPIESLSILTTTITKGAFEPFPKIVP